MHFQVTIPALRSQCLFNTVLLKVLSDLSRMHYISMFINFKIIIFNCGFSTKGTFALLLQESIWELSECNPFNPMK